MPIVPKVGRKTLKIRLVVYAIYLLLILGSVTMAYPFLIMLSGSVKGIADTDTMDAVPEVIRSEPLQFARFQEERYGNLVALSAASAKELMRSTEVEIPKEDSAAVRRYRKFLQDQMPDFPEHFYVIQESWIAGRVLPRNFRLLRDEMRRECGAVDEFNRRYGTSLPSWNGFSGFLDRPLTKEAPYEKKKLVDRFLEFKRSRPLDDKAVLNIDGHYFVTQRNYPAVRSGRLSPSPVLQVNCPKGPEGELWAEFVKHNLNCLFVKVDDQGLTLFREYLAEKNSGSISRLNQVYDTTYSSFDDVKATYDELRNGGMFALYTDFVTNVCPAEHLLVDTPSTRYRDYISAETALAPFTAWDYDVFKRTKKAFMLEMFTRNYVSVIQYIVIYGRAILNTMIYVGLSILAALTVNPIAAYALSRFRLRSTYGVLMFFMATMAFPGAVTMIPNFLLLKQLHLLNTYWALVLPGVANGYSIFILKGFFDSIPREVYESAMIDGAGEWTMFWRFTMALSKPILALLTLSAFTAAYSAFMFALIICPDERVWTLMVWLYQLQQDAAQPVVYAALVLAALPTLLVFVLAQNTIMKGIVVPVEK